MFSLFVYFITTVLGQWFTKAPKQDVPAAAAIGEFNVTTAELGRAVPVVYGTPLLSGGNCVWYGDLRVEQMTEKVRVSWFKKTTVHKGYRYFMGAQIVFCRGFSPGAVASGSGLRELRIDSKPFTAFGVETKDKASYRQELRNPADANKSYARVTIVDNDLYGGDEQNGGFSGDIDFYYGQGGQEPNDYLQRAITQDIPAFRGYCHAVLRQAYIGTTEFPKQLQAIVGHFPWFWGNEGAPYANINDDANPIACLVDLLTSKDYGLGYSFEALDFDGSFYDAAMQCSAEGLGLTLVYDRQGSAGDFIEDLLRHIDGVLYVDPSTGKFKIVLARSGYSTTGLPRLNADNVTSLVLTRASWNDTRNVVKVKYTNRADNYKTGVVEVKNQANIDVRGGLRDEDTYEYAAISNAETANMVAARILKNVSTPMARLRITANRESCALHRGAVFLLDWPAEGIVNMACRVTNINYGDMTSPELSIEAVEDVFGLLQTQILPPAGKTKWEDPVAVAIPANLADRLVEVPHFLMGGPERGVMTLGARANGLVLGYNVDLWQSGQYVRAAESQPNTPAGTLSAPVPKAEAGADITVVVPFDATMLRAATAFERDSGDSLMLVDDELIAFAGLRQNSDGTVTLSGVLRGVLDTVPAAHSAGARVWFVSEGAGSASEVPFAQDEHLTARFTPIGPRGEAANSGAPVELGMVSRAARPLPPGRVRVNDEVAPSALTGPAQVSWQHRSKEQQLASRSLVAQTSAASTLVPGTSYSIEVLLDGTVVRTVDAMEGSGFGYTPAMRAADSTDGRKLVSFRIAAVKDALASAQKQVTAPAQMTGLGMCFGEQFGGKEAA